MRIGELAGLTGVSVRALRYYEEQALLTSERSDSGQRQYPDWAVDRVELIQLLYAAGLSSHTIAEVLPGNGPATPATLALVAAERDRIEEQISGLRRSHARLCAVLSAAAGDDHGLANNLATE
jgi:DNA-binding transcriptional MerR regulator